MNLLWRVIETEEETILKDGIPRTFYAGVITHIKFELQHLEEKVVKWMGYLTPVITAFSQKPSKELITGDKKCIINCRVL